MSFAFRFARVVVVRAARAALAPLQIQIAPHSLDDARSTGARTYRVEHNISEACEDPRYRRAPAAVAVLRVGDDEAPMLDIAPLRVVRVREGDIVGANVTVTLRSRPKSSVAIAMDVLALNPVYGAQVNQ